MASIMVIKWDEKALRQAVSHGENLAEALEPLVGAITQRCNSLSSEFRTGIYHVNGHRVGNTQPRYGGDVKKKKGRVIGIVHPENYSAMKDNMLHNTLLKAR